MQRPPTYPYRPSYQPPPPPWYTRLWRWYRSQSRRTQIALVVALVLFLVIGSIANATATPTTVPQPATSIATDAPTDIPTVDPNDNATASADEATVEAQVSASMTASVPTPTPKPTPRPTTGVVKPTPTPQHTGVNGNPWGYDFSPGNLIYNPPADFCSYFNCIASFWNGHGFVNECQDGSYSLSGGVRGDCSYHGGEMRPLYSH